MAVTSRPIRPARPVRSTDPAAPDFVDRAFPRLPAEDRAALKRLTILLFEPDSGEDVAEILATMREIAGAKPVKLVPMELDPNGSDELDNWKSHTAKTLKRLRKAANLTQGELAKKSGLPQSHISRLESAKHCANHLTLTRLASGLGVKLSELDPSADD